MLACKAFPLSLGDNFDYAVEHLHGILIVDRVRRPVILAASPSRPSRGILRESLRIQVLYKASTADFAFRRLSPQSKNCDCYGDDRRLTRR